MDDPKNKLFLYTQHVAQKATPFYVNSLCFGNDYDAKEPKCHLFHLHINFDYVFNNKF